MTFCELCGILSHKQQRLKQKKQTKQNRMNKTTTAPVAETVKKSIFPTKPINAFVSEALGEGKGRKPKFIKAGMIPSVLNNFFVAAPSQEIKLTDEEMAAKTEGMTPIEMVQFITNPKNRVYTVQGEVKTVAELKETDPERVIPIRVSQLRDAFNELVNNVYEVIEQSAEVEAE